MRASNWCFSSFQSFLYIIFFSLFISALLYNHCHKLHNCKYYNWFQLLYLQAGYSKTWLQPVLSSSMRKFSRHPDFKIYCCIRIESLASERNNSPIMNTKQPWTLLLELSFRKSRRRKRKRRGAVRALVSKKGE